MQPAPAAAVQPVLTALSSMATRPLLNALFAQYAEQGGCPVVLESAGGVDAARRVQSGAVFDLVFLARDAIDTLVASGHLQPLSPCDIAHSSVAVAVRAGAARPDIRTPEAVRSTVRAARSIGYSTGPSGVALARQFDAWGIAAELQGRLVQAAPGVPVGRMVASGAVELGFQQLSELMHLEGIAVLGCLPESMQIRTTFSAGVMRRAAHTHEAAALLQWLASDATSEAKRRMGMQPVGMHPVGTSYVGTSSVDVGPAHTQPAQNQ